MKGREEARLNMYRALAAFAANKETTIATVPALEQAFTALNTTIAAINNASQRELMNTTGVTVSKAQNKQSLATFTTTVASAVYAWAAATGNAQLKKAAKTSFSGLMRIRDEQLGAACLNYYDLASTHKAALTDYGVNDAQLTAFNTAILAYTTSVPTPRNAVAQRAASRAAMTQLFKTADALLKERIDTLLPSIKTSDISFKKEFQSNRTIVNPGTTVTQLKLEVTDAATAEPVMGATLQLPSLGISAVTNKTGALTLKPLPPGTYDVTIAGTGYTAQAAQIIVKLGQVAKLKIELAAWAV